MSAIDYEGNFILRFDDTNPTKESEEFQISQQEDLKTIGCFPDKISFTSNYFDQLEAYCIQMIKLGKAYCDDTPTEKMRHQRMEGLPSDCRDRPVEDNLRIFNEMKKYSEEGSHYTDSADVF